VQFGFPFLDVLVIPTDAGPGDARIVIDGTTGLIEIYDENDVRIGVFGPFTTTTAGFQIGDDAGGYVRITATAGGVATVSYIPGPVSDGSGNTFVQGNMQAGYTPSGEQPTLIIGSPKITGEDDIRLTLRGETGLGARPRANFDAGSGVAWTTLAVDDKDIGIGVLLSGIQRETTADSARAAGVNTDMVRTVDLLAGHWYRAGYSGNISIASGAGTSLSLSRDGSKIGLMDYFPAAGSFKSNAWVDFQAAADDAAVVMRLLNDASSAGTLTLTVNANEARVFSIVDLGMDA
jgi:hypothetical protein